MPGRKTTASRMSRRQVVNHEELVMNGVVWNEVRPQLENRTYLAYQPLRKTEPGRAPVCSPASTTSVPFTRTW